MLQSPFHAPRIRTFAFLEPLCAKEMDKLAADKQECRRRMTLKLDASYGAPGSVVLASTIFYRADNGEQHTTYRYHVADTEADVVQLVTSIRPPAVPNFYYMVNALDPVSLYLDFDAPRPVFASEPEFRGAVLLAVHYLRRFLNVLYCCDLQRAGHYSGRWAFFGASTEQKWSMHVHAADLRFENVLVLKNVMLAFVALMRTALCRIDPCLEALFYRPAADASAPLKSVLDDKVYTARPFRLPLCSKTATSNNKLLPLDASMSPAECVRHGFVHHGRAHLLMPPLGAPVRVSFCANADPAAELERLAARFALPISPVGGTILGSLSTDTTQLADKVVRRNLLLCAMRLLVKQCRAGRAEAADVAAAVSTAHEFVREMHFSDRLGFVCMTENDDVELAHAATRDALCMADYAELEAFAAFALTRLDVSAALAAANPMAALACVVSVARASGAELHDLFLQTRGPLNAHCALTVEQIGMFDGLLEQ